MMNRISQIYADRQARLGSTRQFDNLSTPYSVSKTSISINEPQHEPTVVELSNTEPRPDFPTRRGPFGILHYTVNNRFKKIMVVGAANVLLILSFLMFMVFFVLKIKCSEAEVITDMMQCSTTHAASTESVPTKSPLYTVICPDGFTVVGQKCWKIFTDPVARTEANVTCTATDNSYPFVINNAEQNQDFTNFVGLSLSRYWIGVTCTAGGITSCVTSTQLFWPFPYSNFATGSPNANSDCIYFNVSDYKWITGDCQMKLPFVCEQAPVGVATVKPSKTTEKPAPASRNSEPCKYRYRNQCYEFYSTHSHFSDAMDQCKSQFGTLVSVEDDKENQFLKSILKAENVSFSWLGGLVASKKAIVWADGSLSNYHNFEEYEEKKACVLIRADGNWISSSCGIRAPFVCKIPFDSVC